MYTRHDEVPRLASRSGKVDARYFNHVCLALKRIDREIRLRIPKLKHLDLILQKDAWIIVDRALYDYPIAAWCEFDQTTRNALHEPIPCSIRIYHYAAMMVLRRTLEAMDDLLNEQLKSKGGSVVSLEKRS